MKYAWIREHRDSFPVAVLCEVLEVSASGYTTGSIARPARGRSVMRRFKRQCNKSTPSRTASTAASRSRSSCGSGRI